MGLLGWVIGAAAVKMFYNGVRAQRIANEKEQERVSTPFAYNDGFSREEFEQIVKSAGKKIKRISEVSVDGLIVYCTVQSQSGISEWYFKVDFNDYGHFTGKYWLSSDNTESSIPQKMATLISDGIQDLQNVPHTSSKNVLKACPYCGRGIAVDASWCQYCNHILT